MSITNEEIIEEILVEASAYGLRDEVIETAAKLRSEDPRITAVTSYELAYQEWIK